MAREILKGERKAVQLKDSELQRLQKRIYASPAPHIKKSLELPKGGTELGEKAYFS